MKNKNYTVLTANLTAHTVQYVDCTLYQSRVTPEGTTQVPLHPKRMQIKNTTGITIGFNIISNSGELAQYQADATNFEMIQLANNTNVAFSDIYPLPTPAMILIQGISGSASADLVIQAINYQTRG